jgi:hypothetical protein
VALASISVPSFWLGLVLILFVGDYLRLLPVGGSGDVQHLILPAITLALPSTGLITRLTRASVLSEMRQPYVTTARAKGLTSLRIEVWSRSPQLDDSDGHRRGTPVWCSARRICHRRDRVRMAWRWLATHAGRICP